MAAVHLVCVLGTQRLCL